MAKPDTINDSKIHPDQAAAFTAVPVGDSLQISLPSLSLEDKVKLTGMCETRGQGASSC